MSQTNSAALPQQIQTSTESLMSNAFDLIGGVSAAQQFLNHMDLYSQQQRQFQEQQQQQQQQSQQQQQHNAQQLQLNYSYQQQQFQQAQQQTPSQYNRYSINSLGDSISVSTSLSSSSGSQSPPNHHTIQQHQQQQQQQALHYHQQYQQHHIQLQQQQQHNKQQHLHHQQQQQQHRQHQQQQLNKHSISLTSSRNVSPINLNSQQQNQQQAPQFFNMSFNNNQQMDIETQQPPTSQQHNGTTISVQQSTMDATVALANTTLTPTSSSSSSISSTIPMSLTPSPMAPSTSPLTSAITTGVLNTVGNNKITNNNNNNNNNNNSHINSNNHQHQHQPHHQHGIGASPYKSCWCYGESIYCEVDETEHNPNHLHSGETTYHMKILVPAVASGAIIGKGGETIASLQKDSGARVKMSKSHDFYPGTTERVCLITGSVDGIMSVLDFIMDKIREKPDLTTKVMDNDSKQQQERDKQVKILVPNSTAGMIIGKGGAFIKQIKEESGSYVQISQKPKDISLQERCITIIGDKENNKNACKMILSKIVEDPQSGTCLNVSYADVNGPVANFNPTGSPYATNQNAINTSTASLNSSLGSALGGAATAAGMLVNGAGINLSLNLGSPNPAPNLAVAQQLLEHIKVALRGSGYSETATTEVCAALGVLAKYGVLGMGVGVPHAANGAHAALGSYLGVSALEQQSAAASAATTGNMFGAVGQVNLEQYTAAVAAAANRSQQQSSLEAQFDPFRLSSATAQASTPVSLNNNSFGLTAATGAGAAQSAQSLVASAASLGGLSKSPTPGDLGAKETKNVEINENIIGAVLGPNGRSLVEIQHVSGANVQISKKGIFAPGTRNRIVTITGQPSAIAKAQFLIEQKINDEETKRARQIPLTTVVN